VRITVKLGGSILEEAATRLPLLRQIAKIVAAGNEILLVHGGGKSLNRRLSQMQMTSQFIDGLRVTDAETLGVAVMVLAGEVNKTIVAEMGGLGVKALGMCGADAGAVHCIRVEGLPGYPTGIGFVGKPVDVNPGFFNLLFGSGLVPVVSSIALGPDSNLYNVNADQMASACASGTQCAALVYLTDVPGIRDEKGKVVEDVDEAGIMEMRTRGILSGGMLPKTSSCLEALKAGVGSVLILPGSSPDILLKLADGSLKEGTKIHGNN
jgi:acetylglutamate kinase